MASPLPQGRQGPQRPRGFYLDFLLALSFGGVNELLALRTRVGLLSFGFCLRVSLLDLLACREVRMHDGNSEIEIVTEDMLEAGLKVLWDADLTDVRLEADRLVVL